MNEFKKQEAAPVTDLPPKQTEQSASPGTSSVGKIFSTMNIMGYVSKEMMVSVMPYVFFLMVFALLYIGNSYHADKMIRAIDRTGKDIKELRSEYIAGKTELMQKSKQSAVAAEVSKYNIKESTVPPRKIVVQLKSNESKK